MTVRISKFNNETKEQFMKSDKKILASESKITGIMADDIILLFNYEIKTYFGIGKVGMFENNVTFRENPIYNVQGVYDGAYSKYSKYEICIKEFYPFKIKCEKLIKLLNIDTKEYNNIIKNSNTRSFTPIYYGSSHITDEVKKSEYKKVLEQFTFIIETTLENMEDLSKSLNNKISILESKINNKDII
jgi:hypothetical protein